MRDNLHKKFWEFFWEQLVENEFAFEFDLEKTVDYAVELGLLNLVEYDPKKHGEVDAEVGDMIYVKGKTK